MKNLSPFCTCAHTDCPFHPTRHESGCSPCIAKNLRQGEIPDCFFNAVDPENRRQGVTFADFAGCVAERGKAGQGEE